MVRFTQKPPKHVIQPVPIRLGSMEVLATGDDPSPPPLPRRMERQRADGRPVPIRLGSMEVLATGDDPSPPPPPPRRMERQRADGRPVQ